ncbi:hypothetical protein ACB098_03G017800 [Castanea mollissima]
MSNLIPQSVQSKMGVYDIEIEGANVKVSIVENPAFIDTKMDELRSSLLYPKKKKKKTFITNFRMAFLKKKKKKLSERLIVGVDIKFVKTDGNLNKGKFLILCVGSDCLMIQLPNSDFISDTLGRFLSAEVICFLGTGMSNIVSELGSFYFYPNGPNSRISMISNGRLILREDKQTVNLKTGVEVGFLAAKILKKPNVENYGLTELAGEVGMDIEEPSSESPDWNAKVFSDEDVKYAVHNAYTSCVIGNKLFDML